LSIILKKLTLHYKIVRMQSSVYESIKTTAQQHNKSSDALVVEAALQININNEAYTVVMRTPNDDVSLIRGLLYAEDIYKHTTPLQLETISSHENGFSVINISIPKEKLGKGYLNKRTLLSVSSCGICGKQKLEDISLSGNRLMTTNKIKISTIKAMYLKMKTAQVLFETTGGSHATAAFDAHCNLLSIKEDIGRHNALDKVVGDLIINNSLKKATCILVSGRVSFEIVSKAFIAKIPIIIAVSACSSLAVDYAKEFGLCLIGFSRINKATIYANQQHLEL